MPIFAASSGMVMPGWPCTNESACAARVPLPLRRPARRRPGGRPGLRRALVVLVAAPAALARVPEPRGRPRPRRRGVALAEPEPEPRTAASAEAAASRRLYSSTAALSSRIRSLISRRLSSRKSVTIHPSSLVSCDRTHTYESSPYTNFLGRTFLEVFAQSLECASGLALWHSAH